ncbi:MAG: hypothetical protein WBC91_17765 [Phototrophicaceae bacterium]
MSNIQILFQIPTQIETGLALGTYERIGGVVRDTGTKQVVMWLQEGSQFSSGQNVVGGLMSSVMHKTGMSSAAASAVLGGTVPVLNLAMAGYTLYLMIESVRELEKEIEENHERVSEEFARDRRIEFEAALANARDVVDAENDVYKQQAAQRAIDQLYKAQQQRLTDFDELISKSGDFDEFLQLQNYLLQAMMTSSMRTRCYLETNQTNVALSRLQDALREYLPRTQHLARKLLGQYPAMYFNSEISEEDFERYLAIEAWIRDIDDVLPILVKEYRSQFWNKETIKPLAGASAKPFWNRSNSDTEPTHLKALTQMEILIENYNRLLGFELELASIRLSFDEWETVVSNLESQDDYVVLVDQDLIQSLDRLSM